eukprot:EG_transcript_17295
MSGKAKEPLCSLCSGPHRTQQCPMVMASEHEVPAGAAKPSALAAAPRGAPAVKPPPPKPSPAVYSYATLKQRLGTSLANNPKLSGTLERIGDTVTATSRVMQARMDAATKEVWDSTAALADSVRHASSQLQDSVDSASRSVQEKVDFVQMRLETPQLQLAADLVAPQGWSFFFETFNNGPHVAYELQAIEKLDVMVSSQLTQLAKVRDHTARLAASLKDCEAALQPLPPLADGSRGRDRSIQRLGVLAITAATTSNDVFEKREQFEARNHERVVAAIEEMKREKDRCRAACEQMRLAADAAWQ